MHCALLAERHDQLREGVRSLIEPLFEVIVMVAEEASLIDALERMEATVAVVDLSLPAADGLALIRRLRGRFPQVTLVAIGGLQTPSSRKAVMAAGAHDFVSKHALGSDLVPAVEAAMRTPQAVASAEGRTAKGDRT